MMKRQFQTVTKKSLQVISIKQRVRYLKLLFKWRGGVWDLLWIDFIWFLGAHILMTVLYHFVLLKYPLPRKNFESFLMYLEKLRSLVPLSFLLGFFVTAVLSRWWSLAMSVPWMSKTSYMLQGIITGSEEAGDKDDSSSEENRETKLHAVRMCIMRYMNMAWIFAFLSFSDSIRFRFGIRKRHHGAINKMKKHLLTQGHNLRITVRERMDAVNADPIICAFYGDGEKFILPEETSLLEALEVKLQPHKTLALDYWLPLQWAQRTLQRAYKAGHIPSHRFYLEALSCINEFRGQVGTMYIYNDWKMPLVYIQVVIFVVYSFLFTEIFTQQIIKDTNAVTPPFHFQTYFPLMTILKYFLYMGWFQIGLCLMYPFEGNNADMPLNDVLNYNIAISTQGCNTNPEVYPESLRESAGDAAEQLKRLTNQLAVVPQQIFTEDGEDPLNDEEGTDDLTVVAAPAAEHQKAEGENIPLRDDIT